MAQSLGDLSASIVAVFGSSHSSSSTKCRMYGSNIIPHFLWCGNRVSPPNGLPFSCAASIDRNVCRVEMRSSNANDLVDAQRRQLEWLVGRLGTDGGEMSPTASIYKSRKIAAIQPVESYRLGGRKLLVRSCEFIATSALLPVDAI